MLPSEIIYYENKNKNKHATHEKEHSEIPKLFSCWFNCNFEWICECSMFKKIHFFFQWVGFLVCCHPSHKSNTYAHERQRQISVTCNEIGIFVVWFQFQSEMPCVSIELWKVWIECTLTPISMYNNIESNNPKILARFPSVFIFFFFSQIPLHQITQSNVKM